MKWKSLIEMFARQAEAHPDAVFTRFLNPDVDAVVYTYSAAWQLTLRWADLLADRGVRHGAKVILALPNTDDFMGAYFGTLLAGGVPGALHPMRLNRADDPYLGTIADKIRFLGATVLVLPEEQITIAADSVLAQIDHLNILSHNDLPTNVTEHSPQAKPDDYGLFQFTSGTSGNSKVAQLTHSALLAQTQALSEALQVDPIVDSAVSWLPLYHDMGIIGFLLTPAFTGGTVNLMKSIDYIMRPGLWIKALSDYGATITGGPPSSYLLVANRMKDSELMKYRLDHVRIALVGAEMVTEESLNKFAEKFAPVGFQRSSLMPTYGMAESGLAISMPPLGIGYKFDNIDLHTMYNDGKAVPSVRGQSSRAFASVGAPLHGTEVAIVDDTGTRMAERFIGEIIVRSRSLMSGYYHQPDLSQQALRDGWLYTGDMGYLADGDLYITGRKKDLLIVGGRNFLPDDLEEVAKAVPGVRSGRVVATSHADPELATEAVVLFAETKAIDSTKRDTLRQKIRKELVRAGYPISKVVLLRPKTIQFTPNGKLKRIECLNQYLAGKYADGQETD